jgi:hypothetical protein
LAPLIRAYAAAGLPNGVEVWRNARSGESDIYFFSPAAAKLISGQLEEAAATSIAPPRLRQGLSRVEL